MVDVLTSRKQQLTAELENLQKQLVEVDEQIANLKKPLYLDNWIAELDFKFSSDRESVRFRQWFHEHVSLHDITLITFEYVNKRSQMNRCVTCGFLEGNLWMETSYDWKWEGLPELAKLFESPQKSLEFVKAFEVHCFDAQALKQFVIGRVFCKLAQSSAYENNEKFLVQQGENYET